MRVRGIRFAALAGGLLVSACFGPAYPEELFCSEAETCPPGQRCDVDGRCRRELSGAAADAGGSDAAGPDAGLEPSCPTCDVDAVCQTEGDRAVCVCNPGFEGDGIVCDDIDECAAKSPRHDCHPEATCTNNPGSFTCRCNPGFFGDGRSCRRATSCRDALAFDPAVPSGRLLIDPDGQGPIELYEVFCDMEREEGGWTLVLVTSDDGTATWTMDNSTRLTTDRAPIGTLDLPGRDFKSPAYHDLSFRDLLFVHAPSGVTAEYEGVGDGSRDFGTFLSAIPYPVCGRAMADQGSPLTGGSLVVQGQLCDTDLYFNLGDHESGDEACRDVGAGSNEATFGPVWSGGFNNGCPFDDPAASSLGPSDQCRGCKDPRMRAVERPAAGFGFPTGLNTGESGSGANHLQMYVR